MLSIHLELVPISDGDGHPANMTNNPTFSHLMANVGGQHTIHSIQISEEE